MDFACSKCANGQCSTVLSLLACIHELRPVAAALVPLPVFILPFGRGHLVTARVHGRKLGAAVPGWRARACPGR